MARAPSADSPATEIFVVEPDGELRQLTGLSGDLPVGGAHSVWSPDGSMLAFGPSILGTNAFPAMLVVNADGTSQRLVKQFDAEEFSRASWSSDGRRLLFSDATPPGDRRIWLADLETGDVTRIATGSVPRWLPDERQIMFLHSVTGRVPGDDQALTTVVFLMDLKDLAPRDFVDADNAHWSPDGTAVLIEKDGELLLADPGGANARRIATGGLPVWSPDSTRFAYLHGTDQDGRALLALADRNGTRLWSDVVGSAPNWSSDGSRLAVEVSYPERVVRVLDAATGDQLWETAGAHPAFRPIRYGGDG